MANISYNRIMRKLVIGFGNLFNNITLVRYNPDGTEQERVIVPLAYATKELYVQRLQGDVDLDKKVQMTLPRMSFEMNGISYDATRKQNTNWKNFVQSDNGLISQYNPVPYNFDFSLNLYIRNIEDGTQIIEHILPYFTPDYTIKLNLVEEMGISKEIPIILNSTNYDVTYEGPKDSDTRMVIWTLNFTVKGFIFGQTSHSSRIQTSIVNVFDQDSNLLIEEVIASANTPPIIVFPPPVANAVKSIVYSATVSTIDQYARDTANGAYIEAQAAFDKANTGGGSTIDQYARNTANGAYIEAQAAFNTANNKVNKSGDTMTGSLILSGEGNDLKFSGGSSLVGNEANNLIKITANANNDITGVAAQSGDGGLVQLYSNGRVEIITDTGAAGALWTFSKDGSLIFPNGTIQTTAFTGYAIDNVARITAQAAFDKANTGGASSIDQYARNVANSAAANTVYIQSNLNSANANITYLFGIETQQNTNIAGVNTYSYAAYSFANNAYAYANTLGTFVNSSISSVNTYSYSAYTTANNASSNIALLQGAMASANANVVYLQTNLNNANANIALLQSAMASANANVVYLQTNLNNANSNIALLQGAMSSANANIVYLQTINNSQNSNTTLLQGAVSSANANIALLQGAMASANANVVYLQTNLNAANANVVYLQTNLNAANANIALLQGAMTSANANIVYLYANLVGLNTYAYAAFAKANTGGGTTIDQFARDTANTAGSNTVYLQAINNAQNANIISVQTLANTDYTTLTATAGVYGNSTYIPSITLASNGRVSSVVNTAIVFPPRYMEIIAVPAANAQVAVTNIFGIVEIPVAGTINMIRARTTTGTCNAIFNINGTSIGYVNANTSGAANTVSTAISAYAALTVDVASPTGNGLVIMVRIQE